MVEVYCNIYKRYGINDLRVVWKADKMMNRLHWCCIVLSHGKLKGMEMYAVELWYFSDDL